MQVIDFAICLWLYSVINVIKVSKQRHYSVKDELNPVCHFLALLGAHHILHVFKIRVKLRLFSKSQKNKNKKNSMALVRECTIPTERQSGRRRLAKLAPTFADRGVSRGQRNGSPRPFNLCFLDRSRYFLFK